MSKDDTELEDDIELEGEYERLMSEFNESDEDEDEREGDLDDGIVIIDQPPDAQPPDEEEVIIDQPLRSEQLSHSFSEFTESLFFCWLQKHRICKLYSFKAYKCENITYNNSSSATQAYDELVDIIHHPQFRKEDVIPNSRRFRKYRQRLLLLPIRSQKINISNKKTPSTSKNIGEAYYLSTTDIIRHILNNPSLFSNMYFGPGQEVTKHKELWHGNIWRNRQDLDKHPSQSLKLCITLEIL